MNAVIYARYSSDNQREESIEARFGNAQHMLKETALQWSGTISTVHFLPKQTIDRIFNR